ncbi:MAG TPA: GNAT family N-acetyltransferase [Minicystis sp.]|nr:GNAT family N-acetyltransferase [Minicystis sp.]
MDLEIRAVGRESYAAYARPLSAAFGLDDDAEAYAARWRAIPELTDALGAFSSGELVGTAAAFTFDMTVPGGVAVPTFGLTLVAVLPTHRRRGVLTALMRRHLEDARARGLAVSGLFASEAVIYGRFGYGVATAGASVDVPRGASAFLPGPAASARARFVDEATALETFPAIWERVRLDTPGMLSRSKGWWATRRVAEPAFIRRGQPPLERVLLEIDGQPEGYAIYRFASHAMDERHELRLSVVEAIGATPAATRALWRYLLDIDIVTSTRAVRLAVDHPLFYLLADARRLAPRLSDALWLRLVDVEAALSARRYRDAAPVVVDVVDAFCPWNHGRYAVGPAGTARTDQPADLALDVGVLGAVYLGGFAASAFARAGRVRELTTGAASRLDALFRTDRAPWCVEQF